MQSGWVRLFKAELHIIMYIFLLALNNYVKMLSLKILSLKLLNATSQERSITNVNSVLPQVRKWSGSNKKFFKVREKAGNFILSL